MKSAMKTAIPRPILILGPTAGGKSGLAVALAERYGGEVIGADSMQVYRGMDAGTAKPTRAMRTRVPHYMIDVVEPTERFTVADWLAGCERIMGELASRGRRAIIVGGTNLYVKSFLEGMFEGPAIDENFRASLETATSQELHERLRTIDQAAADWIHPNDRKKITRALEVFHVTGKPISALQTQWGEADRRGEDTPARRHWKDEAGDVAAAAYRHDPVLLRLDWSVEGINRRINARVKAMFFPEKTGLGAESGDDAFGECGLTQSLPDEVRRLEAAGVLGPQAREALGYKQVLAHFAGACTLDDAFEQTKILTRRFAKTQRTWLKRFRGVTGIDAEHLGAQAMLDAVSAAVGE
jgi:tRNA dimethylallyltransferase